MNKQSLWVVEKRNENLEKDANLEKDTNLEKCVNQKKHAELENKKKQKIKV